MLTKLWVTKSSLLQERLITSLAWHPKLTYTCPTAEHFKLHNTESETKPTDHSRSFWFLINSNTFKQKSNCSLKPCKHLHPWLCRRILFLYFWGEKYAVSAVPQLKNEKYEGQAQLCSAAIAQIKSVAAAPYSPVLLPRVKSNSSYPTSHWQHE